MAEMLTGRRTTAPKFGSWFLLSSAARSFASVFHVFFVNLCLLGLLFYTDQGQDAIISLLDGQHSIAGVAFKLFYFTIAVLCFVIVAFVVSMRLAYAAQWYSRERKISLESFKAVTITASVSVILVILIASGKAIVTFYGLQSLGSYPWSTWYFTATLLAIMAIAATLSVRVWPLIARDYTGVSSRFFVLNRIIHRLFTTAFLVLFVASALIILLSDGGVTAPETIGSLSVATWATAFLIAFVYFALGAIRATLPSAARGWAGVVGIVIVAIYIGYGKSIVERMYPLLSERHLVPAFVSEDSDRLQIDHYAEEWLKQHCGYDPARQRCDLSGQLPVYIVLAEGGGIRAAQQTAVTLDTLDTESEGEFLKHAFVMSGVSGGAIGIVTHLANKAAGCPHNAEKVTEALYRTDHFASLIAGLLFLDFPAQIVPLAPILLKLNFPDSDRAFQFERSFIRTWRDSYARWANRDCWSQESDIPLTLPLETLAKRAAAETALGPVVMFSTVRAEDGELGVVSNVAFVDNETSALAGEANRMGVHAVLDGLRSSSCERLSLSAITAAHVSARFPWTNPPAVVDLDATGRCIQGAEETELARFNYVDGAFFDNSGAAAARPSVQALFDAAARLEISHLVDVRVVHIYAREIIEGGSFERSRSVSQTLAPLSAAIEARRTRGRSQTVSLCQMVVANSDRADLAGYCERLHEHRSVTRLELSNDFYAEGIGKSKATIAIAPEEADDLFWINIPAHVSSRPGSPEYAPLGWLLTHDSQSYIFDESRRSAKEVYSLIFQAKFRDSFV